MSAPTQEFPFDEPVDFTALYARLRSRRWWSFASVLSFSIIFAAIAFLTTPVYRATVVLAPANTEHGTNAFGPSSALGGLASGLGLGPKDLETEEALSVLRSREFTEKFVEDLQLMPKLFAKKWDSTTGSWRAEVSKPPTLARAYKYFNEKIRSVIEDKKTGLITVQIDWTNRDDAAAWANELVLRLNAEMRARAIAKADGFKKFLDKEAETASTVEARDAISRLMEVQVKQRMLASVVQDYSFRVVDRAIPADIDDPVWPKKWLLIISGVMLGLAVGVVGTLVFDSSRGHHK
jgi:uncharacterized protein involved in exopolysaccharide biosynthesis